MRLALTLTLALRGLFLARFGWDPRWANAVYLGQARSLAVGPARFWGAPLPQLALAGARGLGLSSVGALELVYLLAHLTFTAGVIGIARGLWPHLPRARVVALALIVAGLPMLADFWGYEDIAATLGAGLFAATVALALQFATSPSTKWGALLFFATLFAGTARSEALAGAALLALILVAGGVRLALPAARRAGLVTVAGVACALGATLFAHHATDGGFRLAAPTYPYYVFFAGLPERMCATPCHGEYPAYLASVRYFGRFVENHGSVLHALLHHPRAATVRMLYKLVEWGEVAIDPTMVGPLPLLLAAVGGWRAWSAPRPRPPSQRRAWLLAAYFAPALFLLAPPTVTMYALAILAPLCLAAAVGAEWLTARLPSRARLAIAVAAVAFAGVWAATAHAPASLSPLLARAAGDLERRCAKGCMTNALPPHLLAEAWVPLDGGVPLPPVDTTSEAIIDGDLPPDFAARCAYRARVVAARAAGFSGPILYLDAHTAAPSYGSFDLAHRYEGPVDTTHAILEATFTDGDDQLRVWSFPPGVLP